VFIHYVNRKWRKGRERPNLVHVYDVNEGEWTVDSPSARFANKTVRQRNIVPNVLRKWFKKRLPFASVRLLSSLAISFSLCAYLRLLSIMQWSSNTVKILISGHRERRYSWSSTNSFYVLHSKTNDASEEICQVPGFKASEVKEKFDSLLSFRREQQNKRWKKYKAGTEETCTSARFAFKNMLFPMVRFKPRII
jgi:hypothetical protein